MALEIRNRCEKSLTPSDEACIRMPERTFCPECTKSLENVCPNCGDELVRRAPS